jgi:phosphoribosylformimino-5-aminoimidazole carboxamide ribotide isomerase
MQLMPAIDIRDGRCVRLLKGDFAAETRYEHDPAALARAYGDLGASWLHVVDLDGAASGRPVNGKLIAAMARASGLRVQVGGGVRSRKSLDAALQHADRVVIGSLAVTDAAQVGRWLEAVGPERITLGLDLRVADDGELRLVTHGWTRTAELTLDAAIESYRAYGLRHVLCTDVDRDGALAGPNVALYRQCASRWPEVQFQASGGVRDAADLHALATTGVAFAISGKALLENRIPVEEMMPFLPNA